MGINNKVKIQGCERKSVLRRSVGKKLPENILNAPKKGFGIPLRAGFNDESFATTLDSNPVNWKNGLCRKTMDTIVSRNNKGIEDKDNFMWAKMLLNRNI